MTYGQIRLRLTQQFPGISLDLIEGWIADRYAEIMGELPWTRLDVQAVLTTVAPYTTGTVALTQGSADIVLTGGTWTSQMTGRAFRVAGRSEYYEFSCVTGTTGTLDRPYEGPTAGAAAYSIFQTVYVLPSDCRLLQDDAFAPLKRMAHGAIDRSDPTWAASGTPPVRWASYMDDTSLPPNMQVELWPIPDQVVSIPFTYSAAAADLTTANTILNVWLQPAALIDGVVARAKAHMKDYAGATFHLGLAKSALANMRTSEAQGMAPARMQLGSRYTRHRLCRGRG